eukprot:5533561-Amphidinium_carterae.1
MLFTFVTLGFGVSPALELDCFEFPLQVRQVRRLLVAPLVKHPFGLKQDAVALNCADQSWQHLFCLARGEQHPYVDTHWHIMLF